MGMTPVRAPDSSTVAILLCTFNGEAFLREQLASIAAQTHEHWSVWASDDGSVDGTLATLARVQRTWPDGALVVRQGPARGLEANFASLIARSEIDAPFFAFCDQDDVWEPTKLERAVAWLTRAGAGTPALCSVRWLDGSRTSTRVERRKVANARLRSRNARGGTTPSPHQTTGTPSARPSRAGTA